MLLGLVLGLASCKEVEVGLYDEEPYFNFYDETGQYRLEVQCQQQNFYYGSDERTRDTVWLQLVSVASVPKRDLSVKLRAYHNTTWSMLQSLEDAESGVHYVPFESEEMKKLLVFHAGNLRDSIPIILLRDPSLKQAGRRLTLRVVDSENAKAADQREDTDIDHAFVTIYTADCLAQPTLWTQYFFLGAWGAVKHDFMIRHSGEKWDDEFIESTGLSGYSASNLQAYYRYKFRNELTEENEKRVEAGLPRLAEANGLAVEFPER